MQVAVFGFVIPGRCLDILDLVFIRQGHAVDALDPGALIVIGVGQVDPYGHCFFEVGAAFDIDLIQPPVLQYEYINHALPLPRTWRGAALLQCPHGQFIFGNAAMIKARTRRPP